MKKENKKKNMKMKTERRKYYFLMDFTPTMKNEEKKKFIKRENAHQCFPLRSPCASSMIAI